MRGSLIGNEIPVDRTAAGMLRRARWYEKPLPESPNIPCHMPITRVAWVEKRELCAPPPEGMKDWRGFMFGKNRNHAKVVLGYAGYNDTERWYVWVTNKGYVRAMSDKNIRLMAKEATWREINKEAK